MFCNTESPSNTRRISAPFTAVPNFLLDFLILNRISGEARQIFDLILRLTVGFHLKSINLTLSEIAKKTTIPYKNINRNITKLLRIGLISVEKVNGVKSSSYCINYESSKLKKEIVEIEDYINIVKKDKKKLPALATTEPTTAITATEPTTAEKFNNLFGVNLPENSDMTAAVEMITRREKGKLENLKNPLSYLASIAGKIPTSAKYETKSVNIENILLRNQAVEDFYKLSMDSREKLIQNVKDNMAGNKSKFRVPFELLARNAFVKNQIESRS